MVFTKECRLAFLKIGDSFMLNNEDGIVLSRNYDGCYTAAFFEKLGGIKTKKIMVLSKNQIIMVSKKFHALRVNLKNI